jgi:hypothetical protein
MDVTTIVSATIAGQIPHHGFRISFKNSEEHDNKTRFVKRFGSRHVSNPKFRPRLVVSYDDRIVDAHNNLYFDLSGSLFLNNYRYGQLANIRSGSSLSSVVGANCMYVTLKTGSFSKVLTASQHTGSTTGAGMTGIYSTSFAIPSNDTTKFDGTSSLKNYVEKSGSITFDEIWGSTDSTVGYFTGSVNIMLAPRTAFTATPRKLDFRITNAKSKYRFDERAKLRVFARDTSVSPASVKTPIVLKSITVDEMYYRIKDAHSGDVVIPFKRDNNGTRASIDQDGMHFEVYMDSLFKGRTYTIDLLIVDRDVELIEEISSVRFRVDA